MSYARPDDDFRGSERGLVQTFFDDLCAEIEAGVEPRADRGTGFLDKHDIDHGDVWAEEVARGLVTCATFVCIMSARFFTRPYCGKEWALFERRCEKYALQHGVKPQLILPIIWKPPLEGTFPEFALAVLHTFKKPSASEQQNLRDYEEHGLLWVMKRRDSSHREAYETIVEQLAARIVKVASSHPLELWTEPLPDLKSAEQKFPSPASAASPAAPAPPNRAHFAIVAGRLTEMTSIRGQAHATYGMRDDDWRPYQGDSREAARFAQTAAEEASMLATWVPVDQDMIGSIRKAEDDHSVAVVLVDPWSVGLTRFDILQTFDRELFLNCCCIVAWDQADPETASKRDDLEKRLRQKLMRRYAVPDQTRLHADVGGPQQLSEAIRTSLTVLKELMATRSHPVRRVEPGSHSTIPSLNPFGK